MVALIGPGFCNDRSFPHFGGVVPRSVWRSVLAPSDLEAGYASYHKTNFELFSVSLGILHLNCYLPRKRWDEPSVSSKTLFKMKRDSKMGLFGLLAGAAIGATVGLLLAPASGKETRKNIKRRAKRAQKDLVDLVEKVRGNAEAAAADAMEDAGKEVSSKAKRAADAVRQSAN